MDPFLAPDTSLWSFDDNRLTIPSNDEYSVPQLRMMIREIEEIIARPISLNEWVTL